MKFNINYYKSAEKFLDSQPQNIRIKIIDAIEALPDGDVKKLTGRDGFRLRIGKYRIVFCMDHTLCTINVLEIASRGQIYK